MKETDAELYLTSIISNYSTPKQRINTIVIQAQRDSLNQPITRERKKHTFFSVWNIVPNFPTSWERNMKECPAAALIIGTQNAHSLETHKNKQKSQHEK